MNRLALRATGLIATAWLLAACPTQPNQNYCDEMTPRCGPNELCDIDGTYGGVRNVCVAKGDCQSSMDCTSAAAPICVAETQTCGQCQRDEECLAKDENTPACVGGMCIQPACEESMDCPATAPICAGTECVMCMAGAMGDADCAARDSSAPYCTPGGTCGACKEDAHCPAETPVCNVDAGECRTCEANDECASGVCDKTTGQCAAEGSVLFVDGTDGDDANTCDSVDSACETIGAALALVADPYQYVYIASGAYGEVLSIDGISVTLVGEGVSLQPGIGQTDTPVITIQNGAEVTIQGLQITGANSGTKAHGVECKSDSSASLIRVIVNGNDALGVDANQCSIVIERSVIANNLGGGLSVFGSSFAVTNNFILGNGNAGVTPFGGVKIENPAGLDPQRFDFNTVEGNQAQSSGDATGVRCSTGTPMTASSNIVYGGVGGPPSIDGSCAWTYSNIEGGPTTSNNRDEDPGFTGTGTGEDAPYHLQESSPLRDAGDPNSDITIDFDGDPRPQGDAPDIGADEFTM